MDAVDFCDKINAALEDTEPQAGVNQDVVSDAPIGVTRVWVADLDDEAFIEALTGKALGAVYGEALLASLRTMLVPGVAETSVERQGLVSSYVSVEVGLFGRRAGVEMAIVTSVTVSGTDRALVVAEAARVMRGWAQDLLSEGRPTGTATT